MAGEITNIRDGIETRLNTISGLQVYDYVPEGVSVTPSVTIALDSMTFNETFGTSAAGLRSYRWILTLRIAGMIPQEQWQALDDYLNPSGTKSILAAIDGDPTLGAVVSYTVMSPGEAIEVSERESRHDGWYYTMEFPLETVF